jgi:hypothetical protein
MSRVATTVLLLSGLTLFAGCGDNDEPPTAPTPPVQIDTTLEGTLTPNGAQTYVFQVTRAGQITARITALDPSEDIVIGLSLGTVSANACQVGVGLANDAAALNTTLIGNATNVGNFCLRLYDAGGTLPGPVDFTVQLSHF